jgi:NAD(P)H-quinone oxidoreductase subunit 4L
MTVGLTPFLLVGAALFGVGLLGALSRRGPFPALMSLQLMAAAIVLDLAAFARFSPAARLSGQLLALLAIVVASAEIVLVAALTVAWRRAADCERGER